MIGRLRRRRLTELRSSPTGLVNDYVRQHGSKQCCFDDLLPYLTLLMEQHRDGVRLILEHLDERFSRQDIDVSVSMARRRFEPHFESA